MNDEHIHWGRLLRRGLALFLATLAVWGLLTVVGAGAMATVGESGDFVTAALAAELGPVDAPGEGLSFWDRLAVRQSPLLSANGGGPSDGGGSAAPSAPAPTAQPLPEAQPAPDHDDVAEPEPAATAAPGNAVERTLIPQSGEGYVTGGGLYLYNRSEGPVDLAAAAAGTPAVSLLPADQGPQILIVHTHSTEAYAPDGADTYVPTDNNTRTLDETQNIMRVGDEIARVLTEMGLNVIHDKGVYDYPQYAGSYDRSRAAVQSYLQQYPTLKLVLDVHRDALVGSDGTVYKAVTTMDGAKTAQVMVVVGANGGGHHPNWTQNLTLGAKLQTGLTTLYPTLARPITLRKAGYNQDLCPGSLLIEVGSHGNTLQEALAGARLFARAAGQVFLGLVG